jgi:hypothetical protein
MLLKRAIDTGGVEVTFLMIRRPPRSTPAPSRRSFLQRFVGTLLLDGAVFEEIENDASAMLGAVGVVTLAGLARGVGAQSPLPAVEIAGSAIAGLVMWLVAGAFIWRVGVKRMGYTSSYPELLRTIGFAGAPLTLLLSGVLPLGPAGPFVWTAAHAWALLALLVAMREALDVSNATALVVCLLALATAAAVVAGMGMILLVAFPAG